MISHTHKFIFVHINKTAGTSITRALWPYSEGYNSKKKHTQICDLMGLCKGSADEYYKFSFARNPWDRTLSNYTYNIKRTHKKISNMTFEEFVKYYYVDTPKDSIEFPHLYFNQSLNWVKGHDGELLVDDFFKFEEINSAWEIINKKIGIDIPLKKVNTSKHKEYWQYYNRELRDIIAERFSDDIEYFGYRFGE